MADISNPTQRLSELLEQEQRCIDRLVEALGQEQAALRSLSNDELAGTNQHKLSLLTEIRALEERRAALAFQLGQDWAMPAESVTLTTIVGRAGAEEAERLRRVQERLTRSVAVLRDANRMSSVLVAGSLLLVNQILSLWKRGDSALPTYSSSGALRTKSSGAFVAKKG